MFEQSGTIANLACSMLKYFGVKTLPNATLPLADKLLEGFEGSVVLLVLDGLGVYNMQNALDKNSFFYTHLQGEFDSVFPPTTVAATTSVESGLFPSQSGWLGWTMYYPQVDENVTVFLNTVDDETKRPAADYFVAGTHAPYRSVVDQIKDTGARAMKLSSYAHPPCNSLEEIAQRIEQTCGEGKTYYYAYYNEPDHTMHIKGVTNEIVLQITRDIEQEIASWQGRFQNLLLFITADHGHIDIEGACLEDYPDIADCLVRPPSIEPRAVNLFVKEGRIEELKGLFKRYFGEEFLLISKEEALEKGLFGPQPNFPWIEKALGDLIAVSTGKLCLFNTRQQCEQMKGAHAGATIEERRIPLIAVRF
jgi:hypothetical protein